MSAQDNLEASSSERINVRPSCVISSETFRTPRGGSVGIFCLSPFDIFDATYLLLVLPLLLAVLCAILYYVLILALRFKKVKKKRPREIGVLNF